MIELSEWGDGTVIVIDEHPLRGPTYWLPSAVSEAMLLVRGRPMVNQLARLVERRNSA